MPPPPTPVRAAILDPAQHGLDAGHQFAWLEGFHHIIVCAHFEPDDAAPDHQQHGNEERRDVHAQGEGAPRPGGGRVDHGQRLR